MDRRQSLHIADLHKRRGLVKITENQYVLEGKGNTGEKSVNTFWIIRNDNGRSNVWKFLFSWLETSGPKMVDIQEIRHVYRNIYKSRETG